MVLQEAPVEGHTANKSKIGGWEGCAANPLCRTPHLPQQPSLGIFTWRRGTILF